MLKIIAIDIYKILIYNNYMKEKNTSLEQKRFWKNIKKGGNTDFFYENLKDLVFYKLKSNVTGTKNLSKNTIDEFLSNFIALTLNKLDIDNIDVYFDYNLGKVVNEQLVHGYLNEKNQLHLPYDIFCGNKNNVFFDMVIIAHELKHFAVNQENSKIVRKIGNNSGEKVYPFNPNLLTALGITEPIHQACFYHLNEHEILANNFAYNFVLDLLNSAASNEKTSLDPVLLKMYISNIEKTYFSYKASLNKLRLSYENELIPIICDKQQELFFKIKDLLIKEAKHSSNEIIIHLAQNLGLFLRSFYVYHNEEVLSYFKTFIEKNYAKNALLVVLYKDLLNISNHVVTKQEFVNYIKMSKKWDIAFDFTSLELDKHNLIENFIDREINLEFSNITKEEFFDNVRLDYVLTENDLVKYISIIAGLKQNGFLEKLKNKSKLDDNKFDKN